MCVRNIFEILTSAAHLFLTLATLSAASCLASFSLSSLSFFVQARIALIIQICRGWNIGQGGITLHNLGLWIRKAEQYP